MDRITRNKILLWIIMVGLANFAAYTLMYWYFQGDASNGKFEDGLYYLRGHFIHGTKGQLTEPVSRVVWIYSFVHSITIWPTIAAVLISMAILARPHIIATMRNDSLIKGGTFVAVFVVVVVFLTGASTLYFVINFIHALMIIGRGESFGV